MCSRREPLYLHAVSHLYSDLNVSMDALTYEVRFVLSASMKSRLRSSGLVSLLLLAYLIGAPKLRAQTGGLYLHSPSIAQPKPVTVSGTVVNAVSGTPVAHALVQIGGRAMLTGPDGSFVFDQFTAARSNVRVTKPGYYSSLEPNGFGGFNLTASQLDKPLRLRLYPEALLTGTVTSALDDEPLQRITVSAMRSVSDENGRRWMQAAATQTNVRGEFRIPVPAGEYRLETHYEVRNQNGSNIIMPLIFPANTSTDSLDMIRVHGGEQQHIDLHPAEGPSYRVDVTQDPAVGFAMMRVQKANGPWFPIGAMRVTGDGAYEFRLPTGSYSLAATKYGPNGPETAETSFTVADHDVSGVMLRFQPQQMVPVELRLDPAMSDNASRTTLSPAVTQPNPMSLGMMLRSTDSEMDTGMVNVGPSRQKDGSTVFRLQPGSYRLWARSFGGWYIESATYGDRDLLRQEMTVAPGGGGLPIELTVSNRTGSLEGTANVKDEPCSCMVYLISTTPSATPVINSGSSNEGNFWLPLAPGTYQAVAFEQYHAADFRDPAALAPFASHVQTVTIRAGEKATVRLDAVTDEEIAP